MYEVKQYKRLSKVALCPILPVGISPMVFMGEICDRKVLHNVVFLPRLLFDPLYVKFFP